MIVVMVCGSPRHKVEAWSVDHVHISIGTVTKCLDAVREEVVKLS